MQYAKTGYSDNWRRGTLISVLFICAAGVILSKNLISPNAVVQETKRLNVSVQGGRPVARAIEVLEARCECGITYEDPRYVHPGDISDVTAQVRRDLNKFRPGEAPKVFVPKSEALGIEYDELPGANQPDGMKVVVQQLIDAHTARGNAGRFRIEMNDHMIHVIPSAIRNKRGDLAAQDSILDSVISVPAIERSGIRTLEAICAATAQANGIQVFLGAVPFNTFIPYHDREGAESQRARDVLANLLQRAGGNWSWQLFYDPGMKTYALNIHQVPRTDLSK